MPPHLPIAIIGAGPTGLAAAAHLLVRGETPVIFEAGDAVGHSIRAWAHVRMFSPWGFNVDQAAAALLMSAGWTYPPKETLPTGGELIEQYLEPLAALPAMRRHIHVSTRVMGVTRKGSDKVRTAERALQPFVVRVSALDGEEHAIEVKAVIDASGTWTSLTGDIEAAMRVALTLPETGVCSAQPRGSTVFHPLTLVQTTSCCGGPAPAGSDACGVQDAEAKASGQAGCGCGSTDLGVTETTAVSCCAKVAE